MIDVLSKPIQVYPEDLDNDKYVFAVCQCPLPLNYGHRFKKSDYPDGVVRFKCKNCGTCVSLVFKKQEEKDGDTE